MQKPTQGADGRTALERLWQGVDARCNSDEGLLYLAKALLAHKPKSDAELRYIRALVEYVFAKRRLEIWHKRNALLPPYDSSHALERSLKLTREHRDDVGTELALEEDADFVLELRKRIGSQISFGGAYRTLSRAPFIPWGE